VVGEGAEEQADIDFLRGYGCDFVQGFFYSKPLPGPQFSDWAERFAANAAAQPLAAAQ
jgi:EAL domain-containing protein (putative c-di-GMP-specific phosphodiesterase class I)